MKSIYGGYMKKKLILFFIFVMPIILFADTGNIVGRVTNKTSGAPIRGVSIYLEDSGIGTYSKEDGTFVLRDVSLGEHTIYARFVGFRTLFALFQKKLTWKKTLLPR
jgi:hypothetical protein